MSRRIFAVFMGKFIHQSVVVYLALIILLRMMAMPLSLMDYTLNHQYIADNLCENRFELEKHCAGSCYLNKKLARSNENQQSGSQKNNSVVVVDYCEQIEKHDFSFVHTVNPSWYIKTDRFFSSPVSGEIFHPPIV